MESILDKKNLIFDLGGVLLNINPDATFARLASLGVNPAMLTEEECLKDNILHRFECGKIGEEQVLSYMQQMLPEAQTAAEDIRKQLADAWCAMIGEPVVEKFETLDALRKRGHKVFLLSNTNVTHWMLVEEKLLGATGRRPEDFFDRIFLSYKMGLRKPDKAIFETLLAEARIDAADTLFIDDAPENCEAARAVGIHAHLVERNSPWNEKISLQWR